MRKGFTLIELLVAMAVLALMIAFASMVFKVSIDTYRVSTATAEIMQKLRAVTDQLDADFKGLRKDAPLLIWFEQEITDPNNPVRHDQIMSFADGDFSSIQLYTKALDTGHPDPVKGDTVIRGNTARVFYGQANVNGHDPSTEPRDPKGPRERNRILARRQHILTADTTLYNWPGTDAANFDIARNESYEHDRLSLAEWKIITANDFQNRVIPVCFTNRPRIDMADPTTYHKLLSQGVADFSIQWAYWDTLDDRFYWFPSDDPDGPYGVEPSHFALPFGDRFGIIFNTNILNTTSPGNWFPANHANFTGQDYAGFPQALKFTFTLYDSKGVINGGMVFSHIVYLEK